MQREEERERETVQENRLVQFLYCYYLKRKGRKQGRISYEIFMFRKEEVGEEEEEEKEEEGKTEFLVT